LIKEAIILAGGLGTRLRTAVPDKPKCMAPVAGKPFINYVMDYALAQGIERFIMALGYQSDMLVTHLDNEYANINIQYSFETEPLGTGGAIQLACKKATGDDVLVLNGDTLYAYDAAALSQYHHVKKSACTLALKPMRQFSRYGVVTTGSNGLITSFRETGDINAGVYAIAVSRFLQKQLPVKFSFEKDYLETFVTDNCFYGFSADVYFIDIGIPEDYERAQTELAALKM
jgi:D-glycero-alpha-D-manno-heptose 1-phosphate guanylyltransferase